MRAGVRAAAADLAIVTHRELAAGNDRDRSAAGRLMRRLAADRTHGLHKAVDVDRELAVQVQVTMYRPDHPGQSGRGHAADRPCSPDELRTEREHALELDDVPVCCDVRRARGRRSCEPSRDGNQSDRQRSHICPQPLHLRPSCTRRRRALGEVGEHACPQVAPTSHADTARSYTVDDGRRMANFGWLQFREHQCEVAPGVNPARAGEARIVMLLPPASRNSAGRRRHHSTSCSRPNHKPYGIDG